MIHCSFVDPETVYTVVYRDKKGGYPCIKRCKLDKFILNRGYELVPDGCRILAFTTDSNIKIEASYMPKPRVRILEEAFNAADYPVRGNRAKGIRLATREVKGVKLVSQEA